MNVYINFISENYIYSHKFSNYSILEYLENNVKKIGNEILYFENIEVIIINLYPYPITKVESLVKYIDSNYSIYNISITYSDDLINIENHDNLNYKLLSLFIKTNIKNQKREYENFRNKLYDCPKEILNKLDFIFKIKEQGTICLFEQLYLIKSNDLDRKQIFKNFSRIISNKNLNVSINDISEISTILILITLQKTNLPNEIWVDISLILKFLEERTKRNIPIDIKSYRNVLNKIMEMTFIDFITTLSKTSNSIEKSVYTLISEVMRILEANEHSRF